MSVLNELVFILFYFTLEETVQGQKHKKRKQNSPLSAVPVKAKRKVRLKKRDQFRMHVRLNDNYFGCVLLWCGVWCGGWGDILAALASECRQCVEGL